MTLFVMMCIVIGIALVFDFLNGFHDAANAIATIVVTRVLTPLQAVIMAGLANFVGYFFLGTAIAKSVGKGMIHIDMIPHDALLPVLFAALLGAVLWNLFTWLMGLPTSSSHALIGGLVGAGIAAIGPNVVILGDLFAGGVIQTVCFIVIAPLVGFGGAAVITTLVFILFQKANPHKTKELFKKLQLVAAAFFSVTHGTNDAQKTMGVVTLALVAGGIIPEFKEVPGWVALACYCAIGIGTMAGGWRIVKTMGTKITKIHAMEGFCANSSAAIVLFLTAHWGIPVSTTHVISGSIMGVGAVESAAKVRWVTARSIVWAWLLTIPATALCAAGSLLVLKYFLRF